MKKNFFIFSAVLLTVSILTAQCQMFQSATKQLPAETLSFITKHFPSDKIKNVEVEREGKIVEEYEVRLKSGAKMKFNPAGSWEEIEMAPNSKLPSGIVPAGISKMINNNYSEVHITEVEKKHNDIYKIKLSNYKELLVDKLGQFVNSDN